MSAPSTRIVYWPGYATYLELWTIGVIISAMVYGGVLSLSLSYIPLHLKTSHDISRRMRNFLLVYVMFMVAVSTVYMVTMIIALMRSLFFDPNQDHGSRHLFQNGFVGAMCTTLASWGADGFMLWRCAILYKGLSRRLCRISLIIFFAFIALISLVSGLFNIIYGFEFVLVFIGVTIILNLITAILITSRILHVDRNNSKAMGAERNTHYMTIIIICVESSALIVVFSMIYFILYFRQENAANIPMEMLVHVYVISPLLIVYRVARGKAVTIRQEHSRSDPAVSELSESQPCRIFKCDQASVNSVNIV